MIEKRDDITAANGVAALPNCSDVSATHLVAFRAIRVISGRNIPVSGVHAKTPRPPFDLPLASIVDVQLTRVF